MALARGLHFVQLQETIARAHGDAAVRRHPCPGVAPRRPAPAEWQSFHPATW
ncbi:MAG: hypothetical protein R3A10_02660 [Caldilineaceae bacterium]